MSYKNILTAEKRERKRINCDLCLEPTLPDLLTGIYSHKVCNVCYAKKGFIKNKEVQKWKKEYLKSKD